jgi:hypothetical protein
VSAQLQGVKPLHPMCSKDAAVLTFRAILVEEKVSPILDSRLLLGNTHPVAS